MVDIFINNKKYTINSSFTVLQACEFVGIQIPRFCYHEHLSIAGNCRMCLVEIEKTLKPIASCAMLVMPNMCIWTNTFLVKKAREGVMEFLLLNHPLDCPICDQGGECDLQDQAILFGNDRGRFYGTKRVIMEKDCGPLIKTVMTRCIHCTRCVRFLSELGGSKELVTFGRGMKTEIGSYISFNVHSEVSGNIIDLCPVGALTSKSYAFKARSWELECIETIDTLDSMCSNIAIYLRNKKIVRVLPILNENINEEWISDKTRFVYDAYTKQRLVTPYIYGLKKKGSLNIWYDIIDILSFFCNNFYSNNNKNKSLILLGSDLGLEIIFSYKLLQQYSNLLINDEYNLWKRIYDFRQLYMFNTTYNKLNKMDFCLLIGINLRLEMPVLLIRLRKEQRLRDIFIFSIGVVDFYGLKILNIGNNILDIIKFLEGKHFICSLFKQIKFPIIIIGIMLIQHKLFNIILQNLYKIKSLYNKNWNGINLVEYGVGKVNLLEFGCFSNTNFMHTKLYHGVFQVSTFNNIIKQEKKKIFIGSFGFSLLKNYDIIVPVVNNIEDDSLFFNNLGYLQVSKCILQPLKNIKKHFMLINTIINKNYEKKNKFMNLKNIRNFLNRYFPLNLNNIGYKTFFCNMTNYNKNIINNSLLMTYIGDNVYQNNVITFLSRNLTNIENIRKQKECILYIYI